MMVIMTILSFPVLTAVTGAQRGAGHASLEAFAVVLLASCFAAIAAFEVMLTLSIDG